MAEEIKAWEILCGIFLANCHIAKAIADPSCPKDIRKEIELRVFLSENCREALCRMNAKIECNSSLRNIAIKALTIIKGDDAKVWRERFAGFTSEQMAKQYGMTGRTMQEILDEAVDREKNADEAIAWLESLDDPSQKEFDTHDEIA